MTLASVLGPVASAAVALGVLGGMLLLVVLRRHRHAAPTPREHEPVG